MKTVSEKLAGWVHKTGYGDIPADIVSIAKRNILDALGTTLAGSREPVTRVLRRFLEAAGTPGQATVIGMGIKASAVEAAMANGTTGHYLDYDDLFIPVAGGGGPHISVAVLPAALAVAELEKKSGKDIIEAYVLGCEVAYRAGRALDPSHYNAGWHTTGTEGILGSVTAAGKLLSCSPEEMAHALGIAASEASGLRENFGTMTKPFHAGQAASKGTKAAMLAKFGLTSSRTVFEGKDGYCNVFSKEPKAWEMTKDLGAFTCLPQIRLKLYPCCAGSHSAIYAMLKLVKRYDLQPEMVERVNVKGDPQMTVPLIYNDPKTAMEGKFSVQFPLALALRERKVVLPEFTDEKVNEGEIRALMARITLIPDETLRSGDVHSRASVVEVQLTNGQILAERCDYPPGTPQNPIPQEDILEKFRSCAGLALKVEETEQIINLVMNMENLTDPEALTSLLRGGNCLGR